MTWTNQPAALATNYDTLEHTGTSTTNFEVDFTDMVNGWKNYEYLNYGIILRWYNDGSGGSASAKSFYSSDYSADTTKRPRLIITYVVPEVDTIYPDKDAMINSAAPTTNYGSYSYFTAARVTNIKVPYTYRSLIQTTLGNVPSGSKIIAANLYLDGVTHAGSNASYLKRITGSWDETTITWNTILSTTTTGQISIPASTSSSQNYIVWVKDFFQGWLDGDYSNNGLYLYLQDESVTGANALQFASSDYATQSMRPFIIVSYVPPISITSSSTSVNLADTTTGGAEIDISGGISPYEILWSNGDTADSISNLWSGQYHFTITDVLDTVYYDSLYVLNDAVWTNLTSAEINSDTIVSTDHATGWNSGASSRNRLKTNEEGLVKYKVIESNYSSVDRYLGLAEIDDGPGTANIDYAIFFDNDKAKIYENGSLISNTGTYTVNDIFYLKRESGKIRYYKNTTMLREVSTDVSKELIIDVSFYNTGSYFANIESSFTDFPLLSINTSSIENIYDYHVIGNGIDETLTCGTKEIFWMDRILPDSTEIFDIEMVEEGEDTVFFKFDMNSDYVISDLRILIDSAGIIDTIYVDSSFFQIINNSELALYQDDTSDLKENIIPIYPLLESGLLLSPNGDSNYDTMVVFGTEDVTDYSFTVFDMEDNTIFTTTNKSQSWNGRDGSQQLVDPGTYKFEIEADNQVMTGLFLVEY